MQSILQSMREKSRTWAESAGLGEEAPKPLRVHLDGAIEWICMAQDRSPDGGVAQTYLVRSKRWANSYPETTGYIIPTFYSYAALAGRRDIRMRARRMTDWECEIQTPEGGVLAGALGDSDQPTIFNTGQVLFGWVRAFEEEGDERYREAAAKAANWLCSVQDDDGCWRRFGSPMTGKSVNTYNTRTAFGLVRAHAICGDQRFLDSAIRNVDWALTMRNANGWLADNCLQDNTQPFTHTIAYAMRGLLEVGAYARMERLVAAAQVIGDAVLRQLPADGRLSGRFDANWNPTVKWSCLTGDCQLGINWARLFQITGEPRYREAVARVLGFVKRTHKLSGLQAERGGIKGSHPISGGYHPWQYPNWATKFFADALMLEETINQPADAIWRFTNDG